MDNHSETLIYLEELFSFRVPRDALTAPHRPSQPRWRGGNFGRQKCQAEAGG